MKMHTGIQKTYKRRFDGTYQEYVIYLLYFEDEIGNKTTKHDKTVVGGIYRLAKLGERSVYGEAKYFDPDDNQEKHLIIIKAP